MEHTSTLQPTVKTTVEKTSLQPMEIHDGAHVPVAHGGPRWSRCPHGDPWGSKCPPCSPWRSTVQKTPTLKPMEVHGGADVHPATHGEDHGGKDVPAAHGDPWGSTRSCCPWRSTMEQMPPWTSMVEKTFTLQPMETHGGADVHGEAHGGADVHPTDHGGDHRPSAVFSPRW